MMHFFLFPKESLPSEGTSKTFIAGTSIIKEPPKIPCPCLLYAQYFSDNFACKAKDLLIVGLFMFSGRCAWKHGQNLTSFWSVPAILAWINSAVISIPLVYWRSASGPTTCPKQCLMHPKSRSLAFLWCQQSIRGSLCMGDHRHADWWHCWIGLNAKQLLHSMPC